MILIGSSERAIVHSPCYADSMYVVLSLFVHGALLWLLLNSPASEEEQPQEVEIEIVKAKGSPRGNRKIGSSINLSQLVPKLKKGNFGQGTGGLQDSSAAYDSNSDWGAGSGSLQMIEHFIPLDRLREQTNGATHYPGILSYHDITGNCNARLVIDRDGCNWKRTRIWAAERHLRVYVLSVLKKVCSLEDAKRLGVSRPLNVDFAFSFLRSEKSMPNDVSELRGNVIVIQRWYQKSIAQWQVGPFRGIFPIPAVSLDPVWLQLNWEKYIKGKDPFYEFGRDYREDP